MSELSIAISGGRTSFAPGEDIAGEVAWTLDGNLAAVDLRLFWYTSGKGTRDVQIVQQHRYETPGMRQRHAFRFVLPEGPYSVSGTLISVTWAIELVVLPKGDTARVEFVLSPTGSEVVLRPHVD